MHSVWTLSYVEYINNQKLSYQFFILIKSIVFVFEMKIDQYEEKRTSQFGHEEYW